MSGIFAYSSLVTSKKTKPAQQSEVQFYLKGGEALGAGCARAILEQLRAAAEYFKSEPDEEGVHEARKALKRSRSVLRLVRTAIGTDYQTLNSGMRELGRRLSDLRDADALAGTLDDLQKRHPGKQNGAVKELRRRLAAQREQALKRIAKDAAAGREGSSLAEFEEMVAALPLAEITGDVAVTGVVATIRRGRKAFRQAVQTGSANDFHEWRKRAKDLRYQMGFLGRLWPHVLDGFSASARELEQRLGEDHNLSVLAGMLAADGTAHERKAGALRATIRKEQQRLRNQSKNIGDLLYAEKPKQWAARMERCLGLRGRALLISRDSTAG